MKFWSDKPKEKPNFSSFLGQDDTISKKNQWRCKKMAHVSAKLINDSPEIFSKI